MEGAGVGAAPAWPTPFASCLAVHDGEAARLTALLGEPPDPQAPARQPPSSQLLRQGFALLLIPALVAAGLPVFKFPGTEVSESCQRRTRVVLSLAECSERSSHGGRGHCSEGALGLASWRAWWGGEVPQASCSVQRLSACWVLNRQVVPSAIHFSSCVAFVLVSSSGHLWAAGS